MLEMTIKLVSLTQNYFTKVYDIFQESRNINIGKNLKLVES